MLARLSSFAYKAHHTGPYANQQQKPGSGKDNDGGDIQLVIRRRLNLGGIEGIYLIAGSGSGKDPGDLFGNLRRIPFIGKGAAQGDGQLSGGAGGPARRFQLQAPVGHPRYGCRARRTRFGPLPSR